MVGVEDEDAVHCLGENRADPIGLARHREQHLEEVAGVGEVVARISERLADRVFVRPRDDGGHLRDQAGFGDDALVGVGEIQAVVIEGRKRADDAARHRHRVRVAAEAGIEPLDLLMQHRVVGDVVVELVQLRLVRQVSEQEKVGDFEKIAVFGELVDRIAAVQQDTGVAVDIGDLGGARSGGGEAGIVSEAAGVAIEFPDVDDVRADRSLDYRQFPGLSVGIIGYGERVGGAFLFVGHDGSLWTMSVSRCAVGSGVC